MLIMPMWKAGNCGSIPGTCAKCQKAVHESMSTLDDAYNVWCGECPHCGALNLLSMGHGLRGYSSVRMWLVLPTDEERAANGLPEGTPTRGAGGPADMHGTVSGELMHRLMMSAASADTAKR